MAELVGGPCLAASSVGTALVVVARRAKAMAKAKATILYNLIGI